MEKLRIALYMARPQKYATFASVVAGYIVAVGPGAHWARMRELAFVFVVFAVLFYTGVYLLNDVLDKPLDALHPRKRKRPVASGIVSVRHATLIGLGLAGLGIGLGMVWSPRLGAFEVLFLAVNVTYTGLLKRLPTMDIFGNTITHPLRVVMGIAVFGTLSMAHLPVILSSGLLYLAGNALKRHLELSRGNAEARPVLKHYSERQLLALGGLPGIGLGGLLLVPEDPMSRGVVAFVSCVWAFMFVGYACGPSWLRKALTVLLAG
jgi:4-hydroxybenzoate polyprenyltransferase